MSGFRSGRLGVRPTGSPVVLVRQGDAEPQILCRMAGVSSCPARAGRPGALIVGRRQHIPSLRRVPAVPARWFDPRGLILVVRSWACGVAGSLTCLWASSSAG